MKNEDIQDQIERTLSSIDGLTRAATSENFEQELFQKLSFLPNKNFTRWLWGAAAAVALLLLLNGITLINLPSDTLSEYEQTSMMYQAIDLQEFE